MSRSYHVATYGCQMNVHDSEAMAGLLEGLGYRPAPNPEQADVIVLNTCCVRGTAEERILGRLGELQRLKQERPDLVLVVAGCLGQEAGAVERIRRRAAKVDVIMGTHNLHRLPELVHEAIRTRVRRSGAPVVEVWREGTEPVGEPNEDPAVRIAGAKVRAPAGRQLSARRRLGEIHENLPLRRGPGVRAWVTIMQGCDNFCAYCVVPYVRGRERSRRPDDIRLEVAELVAAGYREAVLLGQNVNAYGRDLASDPGHSFAGLLRELDRVPGLARLRYTTSHPRDFGDDIIAAVAEAEHVCENFHLPAQSGSTRILEAMNRRYSREDYLALIDRIRRRVPGAAFTTDLIVGFPGETEDDFTETLTLVREVGFASSFTFAYSPRPGTVAAALPEQLPSEVKQERLARLIELQNEVSLEGNRAEVGRLAEVLVEGEAERMPGMAAGRSRTNKLVVFSVADTRQHSAHGDTVGPTAPAVDGAAGRQPASSPKPTRAPAEVGSVSALVGREVTVRVERAFTWRLEGRGGP